MRKTHTSKIILLTALCCAFSTACSGGGGMSQSVTPAAPAAVAPPASPTPPQYSDTGIAGSVAAPAAGTFGSAPPQLATPGGPTFDGSSGSYPSPNVTLPLLTTALQKTSTGLSPAPGDTGATLTISTTSSGGSKVFLTIPSVGINNQFIFFGANLGTPDPADNYIYGLSYVATSGWGLFNNPVSTNPRSTGVFVFGFETPQAAMPTSGTAVFSGQGLVSANVYKTVGTEIQTADPIAGNASISANFGSGAVTGSFTKMQTAYDNQPQPWNDVTLNANIATGTNRFSGTTAAASAPNTPMSLSGSATGTINGAFYGPAAQQLGAVWTLSDGKGAAIGTVVAGH